MILASTLSSSPRMYALRMNNGFTFNEYYISGFEKSVVEIYKRDVMTYNAKTFLTVAKSQRIQILFVLR